MGVSSTTYLGPVVACIPPAHGVRVLRVYEQDLKERLHCVHDNMSGEAPLNSLHYWLPNISVDGLDGWRFYPHEEDCWAKTFCSADMINQCDKFQSTFSKEIAKLRKFYGEDNVLVRFGCVSWQS